MHLSPRQWQLLSAVSFGIYSTGMSFVERPNHVLDGTVLSISFSTEDEFRNYTRRAFAVCASRLVAFAAVEIQEKTVKCKALFNHTPSLQIDEAVITAILASSKNWTKFIPTPVGEGKLIKIFRNEWERDVLCNQLGISNSTCHVCRLRGGNCNVYQSIGWAFGEAFAYVRGTVKSVC